MLAPCPFCKGDKFKIDQKKSNNFRYNGAVREDCYTVTVRCNKCHARGPTTSIWLPVTQHNAVRLLEKAAEEVWNKRG